MAKKILAVVLAVMMAVSAMAVTAFADEDGYRIDMRSATYKSAAKNHIRITFDIPVWGTYGYLTAGDYTVIKLPTWFGSKTVKDDHGVESTVPVIPEGTTINWYIDLDGRQYSLKQTKTTATIGTSEHLVYLGFYGTSWDGEKTTIPQTIGYNALSSFRIVGTLDETAGSYGWDGSLTNPVDGAALFTNWNAAYQSTYNNENAVKADWFKEGGDPVTGSTSYVNTWNPAVTDLNSTPATVTDFVSTEWNGNMNWDKVTTAAQCPLTWDQTIEHRSHIYSFPSDGTAKLVVKLAKPIVGYATYTLWARNNNSATFGTVNPEGLWWNYKEQRTFVNTVNVTGRADELVFDVPASILMDRVYGAYNTEFAICENITLMNENTMEDYLHADTDKAGKNTGYGELSWGEKDWQGNEPVIKLNGEALNYARTGEAGTVGADVTATEIYLLLPEATVEEEGTGVDQPTQGTDQDGENEGEGDEMNVGDTDDTPTEGEGEATTTPEPEQTAPEQNPPTGIALAVIPMILAAAAAVVAKKH